MARPMDKILSVRFNQAHSCFTCALGGASSRSSGVRVYNLSPLCEHMHIDKSAVGSVRLIEMLDRTNMLAIVAGGEVPKFADNSVLIWDDLTKKFIIDITFDSAVLNVRLGRSRLVVALLTKVYVFRFPNNVERLMEFTTRDNPKGICELSASDVVSSGSRKVLAFPGYIKGTVQLVDVGGGKIQPNVSTTPVTISAHQSEVACLALNMQGSLVATASSKGTLIRVYNTTSRDLLRELRRGSDTAQIYCLNFNPDSSYLCASSDKGTVHVFSVQNANLNRRSYLGAGVSQVPLFGGTELSKYVGSEWNMAQFTVPAECACICAFGPQSSIVAVCIDGTFHRYVFNADGQCNREAYNIYIDMTNEDEI